jgi:hypothetical protein
MEDYLKVYVVIEEDRGYGASVVGVFARREDAEAACAGGYCSVCEEEVK